MPAGWRRVRAEAQAATAHVSHAVRVVSLHSWVFSGAEWPVDWSVDCCLVGCMLLEGM